MKINIDKIRNDIIKEYGENFLISSVLRKRTMKEYKNEDLTFKYFVETYAKNKNIIEIGTNRGISSLILAMVGNIVYTYDIEEWNGMREIWKKFNVGDKIVFNIRNDDTIFPDNFDFAFIDGEHDYESVEKDFKESYDKNVKIMLFHDYTNKFPDYKKFIDEITTGKLITKKPYALWINE